jgi:hypothetical protein
MGFAKWLVLVSGVAAFLSLHGADANAAANFDKPFKTVVVPLPRDPDNPQAKPALTCANYLHFMVKQIDTGEEGADQLSILPVRDQMPACSRANFQDEKIVSPKDWSGYFSGVKGSYVIFDADDGWNDGLGFAVFDTEAKKLFDDVEKSWIDIAPSGPGLKLHYVRVYGAKCSLMAGETCWAAIRKDTGLTGAAPDCAAAYRAEQKRTPRFAKEDLADPTVIDYEATATVGAHGARIAPVTGKALRCRPAE